MEPTTLLILALLGVGIAATMGGETTPAYIPPSTAQQPLVGQFFFPGYGWRFAKLAPPGVVPQFFCYKPGKIMTIAQLIAALKKKYAAQPKQITAFATRFSGILDQRVTQFERVEPALPAQGMISLSQMTVPLNTAPKTALQFLDNAIKQYKIKRIHVDLVRLINEKKQTQFWYKKAPGYNGALNIQAELWINDLALVFMQAIQQGWTPKRLLGPKTHPADDIAYFFMGIGGSLVAGGPVGAVINLAKQIGEGFLNAITAATRAQNEAKQNLGILEAIPLPPSYGVVRWIWSIYADCFFEKYPKSKDTGNPFEGLLINNFPRPYLLDALTKITAAYADYPSRRLPVLPPVYQNAFDELMIDPYQNNDFEITHWFLPFGDYIYYSEDTRSIIQDIMIKLDQYYNRGNLINFSAFSPEANAPMIDAINMIISHLTYDKDPQLVAWYQKQGS